MSDLIIMYRSQTNSQDSFFWKINCFSLLVSAVLLYWIFPVGGALDHQIIAPWVSSDGTFPYRESWWLTTIAHQAVKYVVIAIVLVILVKFIGGFYVDRWRDERWANGYILFSMLLSCGLIGALKANSSHACPWSLAQSGAAGVVWLEHSITLGRCYPGGHASAGFSLLALFFAYRQQAPQRALFYLLSALILGFAMGWAQMMRGAHFMSHNLWTLWVTWAVNVALYALCFGWLSHRKQLSPYLRSGDSRSDLSAESIASGSITVTDNPPNRAE